MTLDSSLIANVITAFVLLVTGILFVTNLRTDLKVLVTRLDRLDTELKKLDDRLEKLSEAILRVSDIVIKMATQEERIVALNERLDRMTTYRSAKVEEYEVRLAQLESRFKAPSAKRKKVA